MVLNCNSGSVPFKYLGLPIGADQRKKRTWAPVLEKVKERLGSWSTRCLSLGGRVTLLKLVLEATPIYYLSFFLAPQGIILCLESMFKQFLWGWGGDSDRIFLWVAWDDVCCDKECGGLGISSLKATDVALLGKWVWMLKIENNRLWQRVLWARYGTDLQGVYGLGRNPGGGLT